MQPHTRVWVCAIKAECVCTRQRERVRVWVCVSAHAPICVQPCVRVLLSLFVFTAICRIWAMRKTPAMKDAESQRGGEKRLGKQMDTGCYLINVFNRERKTSRCSDHSHIAHVRSSPSVWTPSLLIAPSPLHSSLNIPFFVFRAVPFTSSVFLFWNGTEGERESEETSFFWD